LGRTMQGASFESARDEIGRDHDARAPASHAGWDPAQAIIRGLETRLDIVQTFLNYSRLLSAP
jgi:hypothetical protein